MIIGCDDGAGPAQTDASGPAGPRRWAAIRPPSVPKRIFTPWVFPSDGCRVSDSASILQGWSAGDLPVRRGGSSTLWSKGAVAAQPKQPGVHDYSWSLAGHHSRSPLSSIEASRCWPTGALLEDLASSKACELAARWMRSSTAPACSGRAGRGKRGVGVERRQQPRSGVRHCGRV